MKFIDITAEYLDVYNFTLFHNKVSVIHSIELTNNSSQIVENLVVFCDGELFASNDQVTINVINPGEIVRISPYKVNIDQSELGSITKRYFTTINIYVKSHDVVLGYSELQVELLPINSWTGVDIIPQTIVSYITPSVPSINNIVKNGIAKVTNENGGALFLGYQTGNTSDVQRQIEAVFYAIQEIGVKYNDISWKDDTEGQVICMPQEVIQNRNGNCIELTLLMASALEAIGLNCVIILHQDFAYLGVWLVNDSYTTGVGDDSSYIEKLSSSGVSEMLLLDCVKLTNKDALFEDALRSAEKRIVSDETFDVFIDVKRCRLERFFPINGETIDEQSIVAEGEHDSRDSNYLQSEDVSPSQSNYSNTLLTKFDIWERKLLDFSLRNTLLNINLRRRALQFISFDINRIEDYLQDGKEYCILPKPNVEFEFDEDENIMRSKRNPLLRDLVLNDIDHHILHTYKDEDDTFHTLKRIYRAARNAIEETGANTLFLAIGYPWMV